jgi:hypothetical protein
LCFEWTHPKAVLFLYAINRWKLCKTYRKHLQWGKYFPFANTCIGWGGNKCGNSRFPYALSVRKRLSRQPDIWTNINETMFPSECAWGFIIVFFQFTVQFGFIIIFHGFVAVWFCFHIVIYHFLPFPHQFLFVCFVFNFYKQTNISISIKTNIVSWIIIAEPLIWHLIDSTKYLECIIYQRDVTCLNSPPPHFTGVLETASKRRQHK